MRKPLIFCLILFGVSQLTGALSAAEEPQTLTIEETLELTSKVYFEVTAEDLNRLRNANPKARPKIYEILGKPNKVDQWPAAIGIFAYIGDSKDVSKLKDFVFSLSGELSSSKEDAVYSVFGALGEMARRDVEGAAFTLREMCNPAYWKNVDFNFGLPEDSVLSGTEVNLALGALRGYAYSLKPEFDALSDQLIKEVQAEADRKYLLGRLEGLRKFREQWEKEVESGRFGASHSEKGDDGAGVDVLEEKGLPMPRKSYQSVKQIREDATHFFEQIRDNLSAGKFDEVIPRLLDDGDPLSKRLQESEELVEELQRQRLIFNKLGEGFTLGEMVVAVDGSAVKAEGPITAEETLVVTFIVDESKEVAKELSLQSRLTVGDEGRMVVYLRVLGDSWYWNPFGW